MSTAKREMTAADIEDLLLVARDKNAVNGITGMLLYVERQFLQYLEGEQQAVESLYRSILGDVRHSGVILLLSGPSPRRVFADWLMGYHRLNNNEQKNIAGAIDLCQTSLGKAIPSKAPEEIAGFMESFYRNSLG